MHTMTGGDYYVVYWYPTIFHREKERRLDPNLDFEDISDNSNLPLKVKKEEKEDGQLIYTLRFEDRDKKPIKDITFELIRKDERRNGFTVYQYDRVGLRAKLREGIKEGYMYRAQHDARPIPEGYLETALDKYDDAVLDKYIDKIFISCYHSAKDLYHKHEIQDSSDGRLKAYLKNPVTKEYLTSLPDINKPNHEALCFFIEQYESLFWEYAHTISDKYSKIKVTLSVFLTKKRKKVDSKTDAIAYLNDLNKLASSIKHVPNHLEEEEGNEEIQFAAAAIADEDYANSIANVAKEQEAETEWYENNINLNQRDYSQKNLEELKGEIWEKENIVYNYFVDYLNSLQGMCGNALTEYNYCKSLLESKYNTEYKYDLELTEEELSALGKREKVTEELNAKDLHRKIAFNIRNSIRYIVEVRSKCGIWESEIIRDLVQKVDRMQRTAEISNIESEKLGKLSYNLGEKSVELGKLSNNLGKKSVKLGRQSLFLGFLSLGLAVLSVWLGFKSCNNNCNCSEKTPPTSLSAPDTDTTNPVVSDSCTISSLLTNTSHKRGRTGE